MHLQTCHEDGFVKSDREVASDYHLPCTGEDREGRLEKEREGGREGGKEGGMKIRKENREGGR